MDTKWGEPRIDENINEFQKAAQTPELLIQTDAGKRMTVQTEREKENPLNEAAGSGVAAVSKDVPGERSPARVSSNVIAEEEDREWMLLPGSVARTFSRLARGAIGTGFVTVVVGYVAAKISMRLNLAPDEYGVVLALLAGATGWAIGYADYRPRQIKTLKPTQKMPKTLHDEEAKAMALMAKTDAGWCTVGMAIFGIPPILARIYPPAALTFLPHQIVTGFVAAAVFILAFGTTISLRTTGAEFARQVQKMTEHNRRLREKLEAEKE
ncbi:hypothetical protein QZM25_32880 [Burkholderia contaminans]|uniref:hypothetical protein n=1 Tax=Burkholderia cepacia complex TaxID=87882 RepID=UPI00264C3621|nr:MULTISPECIES: hypothetical protein [Burkholderia cepacia complex]MDN7577411.1 hypothetical protein [Burkholderia contaminans]MDN7670819.1 hypothetical protein [Burkholderia vietnamiensis]